MTLRKHVALPIQAGLVVLRDPSCRLGQGLFVIIYFPLGSSHLMHSLDACFFPTIGYHRFQWQCPEVAIAEMSAGLIANIPSLQSERNPISWGTMGNGQET